MRSLNKRWLFGLLSGIAFLSVSAMNYARMRLDDDHMYLYTSNFLISAPASYQTQSARWMTKLVVGGYPKVEIDRFRFRFEATKNYYLYAASLAAVHAVISRASSDPHYVWWILCQMRLTAAILTAAAIIAFWIILKGSQRDTALVVLAFMTITGLAGFLPSFGYRYGDLHALGGILKAPVQALYLLVQPSAELSIFGTTPRSLAALWLIPCTLLRWKGKHHLAYLILPIIALHHAIYGLLALAIFLAVDLICRPDILRKPVVWMAMLVTLAWSVAAGMVFGSFGGELLSWTLVSIAVGLTVLLSLPFAQNILARLLPIAAIREMDQRLSEALILVALVCILIAFTIAAGLIVSAETNHYVVQEIGGRTISLIRIPLLLDLLALVLPWWQARHRHLDTHITVVACLLSLVVVARIVHIEIASPPLPSSSDMASGLSMKPKDLSINPLHAQTIFEQGIYFDIARNIDREPN